VTRSALASILITVLFWGALYVVHQTDMILTTLAEAADERVARQAQMVEINQQVLDRNQALPEGERVNVSAYEFQRDAQRLKLEEYQASATQLRWWQQLMVGVKTPLPKTTETVDLMSRWLVEIDPILEMHQERDERRERRRAERRAQGRGPSTRDNENDLHDLAGSTEVTQRVYEALNARKVTWIIGSSLGFEAVVLGLGAWVFCRRDY
jgi:hypothetical protein